MQSFGAPELEEAPQLEIKKRKRGKKLGLIRKKADEAQTIGVPEI